MDITDFNYNDRVFVAKSNSSAGEVDENTYFWYKQNGRQLIAYYKGGNIAYGQMLGTVFNGGELDFAYQHLNTSGELKTGICFSKPEILPDGRIILHEAWQWTSGDGSKGNSIIEEIKINEMNLDRSAEKAAVFSEIQTFLDVKGFKVIAKDHSRPWGGFFVLDESQAPEFIAAFFPHLSLADFKGFEKLSPKILVVAPDKRLSWQYHHRRAEIWKLIHGVAGVVISDTDEETELKNLEIGDIVNLKCGERHRLVGTDGYGVVAEIWQHVDKNHPSDEDDIVRVQDDFGR